ncbi:hypothetical protein, partial [Desertibacillus haloalkaliphilus]
SAVIDEVIAGVQEQAKQLGYEVVIKYSVDQSHNSHPWGFLKKEQLAGVIILNMLLSEEELLDLTENVPFVQCGQYAPITNTFAVTVDDTYAGYDVVNHLIQLGKKKIAFIGLGKEGMDHVT